MDKKKLNEEIVLCRSIVKKAKVCVIRKLIKKIKLLRSCKKEELREKKLRKGRRLAAEVHMMKTLRPDYVTKFALLTENYVPTGSNTKLKRKRNACAKLVKHKDLVEKVNSIRDKFSNWKEELPVLLNSSKKKKAEDEEANTESVGMDNLEKSEEVTVNEELLNERLLDVSPDKEVPEHRNKVTQKSKNKVKIPKEVVKPKQKNESVEVAHTKKKVKKRKKSENVDDEGGDADDVKNNNSDAKIFEPKIDDPFFIAKKVIVPTLLQKGNEDHPENDAKEFKRVLSRDAVEEPKPPPPPRDRDNTRKRSGRKSSEIPSQDELHPSWKAKKIQMIKPFEGKKIKFEEESYTVYLIFFLRPSFPVSR